MPTTSSPQTPPPLPFQTADATGGIIPYKNPHALTAYYLGIFSIIPGIGFILGCIAIPLGISGLRQRKMTPSIRGTVHAWIGISIGGFSVTAHLALLALAIYGIAQTGR